MKSRTARYFSSSTHSQEGFLSICIANQLVFLPFRSTNLQILIEDVSACFFTPLVTLLSVFPIVTFQKQSSSIFIRIAAQLTFDIVKIRKNEKKGAVNTTFRNFGVPPLFSQSVNQAPAGTTVFPLESFLFYSGYNIIVGYQRWIAVRVGCGFLLSHKM